MASDDSTHTDDEYPSDNPITPWIYEIVTVHGSPTAEERLGQMAELVDRLEASNTVPMRQAFGLAHEVRDKHSNMVALAEIQDDLDESHGDSLIHSFDRLLMAWVERPDDIDAELREYCSELAVAREATLAREEGD